MPNTLFNSGDIAVVTGAALGIGRAAARRLTGLGVRVAIVDLPGADLDAIAAEIPEALILTEDLSDPAAPERIAAEVLDRLGAPHLLMNNAVTRVGRGFDADPADWRAAIEVNLMAPIGLCRAFVPAMMAAGGTRRIVNVGSKQGITNPPGHPVYNLSKAALKSYTESLEHELRQATAPRRVTAHLLVPGWTTTGHAEPKPGAWAPEQVIAEMETSLARGDFYIVCPDGEVTADMDARRIRWAADDIVEHRPPLSRWHPDWKEEAAKACS